MASSDGYDEINQTMQAADDAEQKAAAAKKEAQALGEHITKWSDRVKRARKHDDAARKQWATDRKMAKGEDPNNKSAWAVWTNLIQAILEVLAAFLYAKNPDVSVRPSPSADQAQKKEYSKLAETLEIMVSRLFHDAGLKSIAKRWVRGSMTVGIGWIKAAMQTRTERDPLMETKLNDLKDNLQRIEALQRGLKEGEEDAYGCTIEIIKDNIRALEGKMEMEIAEGLVIDIMAPEDVNIDPGCGEIENYLNAGWVSFDLYKDIDEGLEITGWKKEDLRQANLYTQRPRKGETEDEGPATMGPNQWVLNSGGEGDEDAENPEGFLRFVEIWSKRDGVVLTMVDGIKDKWAREPYAPRTGKRFYPLFKLSAHPIDGDRWPQSDVFQLTSLQNEYNSIRSSYKEHRRRAVPGILFNESQINEESIKKIQDSTTQEWVGIKPLKHDIDINTLFAAKKYNPVDPGLYDTEAITSEMEKVSGAQDAVQGGIMVEKTATEAQIMEAGRGARTGARLDNLEDALTELAEYTVQLMLQTMDREDAQRYAGPNAMWMDMTTDEALTLFSVSIKAGSTGKPKALSDRESWATIMPMIEQTIDRIGQARMAGQEWAAAPWIALLQETSKRLDDALEIDKFLPEVPQEVVLANGKREPTPEELAELRNTDADTIKKLAETLEKNPLFAKPAADIAQQVSANQQPEPQQEAM